MRLNELLMTIVYEFCAIFVFLLVVGYLLPAGGFYWAYHVRVPNQEPIQSRRPSRRGVIREIKLSLLTILIFSVLTTGLYQLYKAGWTSLHWEVSKYPLIVFPLSILGALAFHDTYFYWSHRWMHWQPIFKYVHLGHHKSVSPTPWAIFAFQPAEAVIQFIGIALIILLIPMHPLGLLLFLWIDTQVNTAGHTGYEIVPPSLSRLPWFTGLNTVTHHDLHHTHLDKNFGAYFNIWDRWMGTYLDAEQTEHEKPREYTLAGSQTTAVK
jgi:Delta7-sterol 5-desaturase